MKKLVYYFALLCGVLLAVSCTKDKATDGNGSDYFVGTWDCEYTERDGEKTYWESGQSYMIITKSSVTEGGITDGESWVGDPCEYVIKDNTFTISLFGLELKYDIIEKTDDYFIWEGTSADYSKFRDKYVRRK